MKKIHKDNTFYLFDNENEVGYLKYELKDQLMYINSTVVHKQYQRQGLARVLVDMAKEYCKNNNYKIIPVCSYVVYLFDNFDYQSVDGR